MSQKVLLEKAHVENIRLYDVYRREGGYRSVEKALKTMSPEAIVEEVKKSGLRGRGGAGCPCAIKLHFIPQGKPAPPRPRSPLFLTSSTMASGDIVFKAFSTLL